MDVRIVHLVRNPIPMMISRRTGGWFFLWDEHTRLKGDGQKDHEYWVKLSWEAYNYCRNNLRTIRSAEKIPWLSERYLRVTHEEISQNPWEMTQLIYNFTGISLNEYITDFIKDLTEVNHAKYKGNGIDDMNLPALNVFRNSTETLERWVRDVRMKSTAHICRQCKLLLEYFESGYHVDNSYSSLSGFSEDYEESFT